MRLHHSHGLATVVPMRRFGAAFWPVWGGWTIPAIIVLFLGLLSLLSFAPF